LAAVAPVSGRFRRGWPRWSVIGLLLPARVPWPRARGLRRVCVLLSPAGFPGAFAFGRPRASVGSVSLPRRAVSCQPADGGALSALVAVSVWTRAGRLRGSACDARVPGRLLHVSVGPPRLRGAPPGC